MKQDESIISGYLTALNDFSQEIGGKTKELKMENSKLKYKFIDDEALFVFVVEETNEDKKKELMNTAIKDVIEKYKITYPKGLEFNGDTQKYYRPIGINILDNIMYPLALELGELNHIIEGRIQGFQKSDYSVVKSDKPFDLDNLEL
jgi:hypothetical protein